MLTMKRTSVHQSRSMHAARSETLANSTLGGLLVYAALIPAGLALLIAPAIAGAFTLGIGTAFAVSRVRAQQTPPTDDGDEAVPSSEEHLS